MDFFVIVCQETSPIPSPHCTHQCYFQVSFMLYYLHFCYLSQKYFSPAFIVLSKKKAYICWPCFRKRFIIYNCIVLNIVINAMKNIFLLNIIALYLLFGGCDKDEGFDVRKHPLAQGKWEETAFIPDIEHPLNIEGGTVCNNQYYVSNYIYDILNLPIRVTSYNKFYSY